MEIRDLATLTADALGFKVESSDALVDEKRGLFEVIISLMTPWGMAELMATMIPDMIDALPDMYNNMMQMVMKALDVFKEPVTTVMKGIMPNESWDCPWTYLVCNIKI
jgi:hypothetical protein